MNMKYFFYLIAISSLVYFSCSKNVNTNENSINKDQVKSESKTGNTEIQYQSDEYKLKFAKDTNNRFDRDSFFDPLPKIMYYRYYNERYGFEFFYPGYLIKSEPPVNGDGQEFTTNDGLEVLAYGSNDIELTGKTLKEIFEDVKNNHEKIYFNKLGDNYFIISGIDRGKLFWTKTFAGKRYTNTLYISYPIDKKRKYDSEVLGYAVDSFKPGILD